MEVAHYIGNKDLKYYEFSNNVFSRAYFASKSRPHRRPQVLATADVVKSLGYKILELGKPTTDQVFGSTL